MTARDNPKEAVQELETVRDAVGDKWPALQYEAMMAEAEARAALDQPGQAESLWWKVAVRAADDRLRAKAAVNRGLSLKKRGQLREALYSFLRVAILHTDQVENYQKALYHAALTAREYYDGNQRAKELASELFSHYPESGWTKRLRNEMKGGGNGSGS
jgi:hypothetical protein